MKTKICLLQVDGLLKILFACFVKMQIPPPGTQNLVHLARIFSVTRTKTASTHLSLWWFGEEKHLFVLQRQSMKTPHTSKFKGDQWLSCKFSLRRKLFFPLNPSACLKTRKSAPLVMGLRWHRRLAANGIQSSAQLIPDKKPFSHSYSVTLMMRSCWVTGLCLLLIIPQSWQSCCHLGRPFVRHPVINPFEWESLGSVAEALQQQEQQTQMPVLCDAGVSNIFLTLFTSQQAGWLDRGHRSEPKAATTVGEAAPEELLRTKNDCSVSGLIYPYISRSLLGLCCDRQYLSALKGWHFQDDDFTGSQRARQ